MVDTVLTCLESCSLVEQVVVAQFTACDAICVLCRFTRRKMLIKNKLHTKKMVTAVKTCLFIQNLQTAHTEVCSQMHPRQTTARLQDITA